MTSGGVETEGRSLTGGAATGRLLRLQAPLSFWGGVDAATGEIIDNRHPQAGLNVSGTVLAMPHGKGSSSASSVLAECLRLGTGPAAILLDGSDEILLVGVLVAAELYGTECPVVVLSSMEGMESGAECHIADDLVTTLP